MQHWRQQLLLPVQRWQHQLDAACASPGGSLSASGAGVVGAVQVGASMVEHVARDLYHANVIHWDEWLHD